jgi:hypothetical protein
MALLDIFKFYVLTIYTNTRDECDPQERIFEVNELPKMLAIEKQQRR